MSETKKTGKRTRTIPLEKKIASIDAKIAKLQKEREELLRPVRIQKMISEATETMSLEEVAERLGVPVERD